MAHGGPRSPQMSTSIGDSPRASIDQPDLRDLRQKARRFAQALGARRQRPTTVTPANVPGVADLSTGVVNSQHAVNQALRKFKESFKRISNTIATEWNAIEQTSPIPEFSFEDIRQKVEINLSRIAFPQRYKPNVRGAPSTQWEYTKAKLSTLEKLDTWMGASVHPKADEVSTFLWKGLDIEFDYLTRPEVPFAHLDLFCTSLQELTTLLPSSLFQVPEKAILEDPDMEAVMGLIYADILALVASATEEIMPHTQAPTFTALYNAGLRHTVKGRLHHRHLHFHRPPPAADAGRPQINTAVSSVQSPVSPTSTSVHPFRRTPSISAWEQTLRTILEQVKYHSQLMQSELSELQAMEQKERFEAIEGLLDEVEEAAKAEDEAKRETKEVEAALSRILGKRPEPSSSQHNRDGSSSSSSSEGEDNQRGESSRAKEELPTTRVELEEKKAQLHKAYQEAKLAKKSIYERLLEQAGHIKCDVCIFTAYDGNMNGEDDHTVDFSSNIREFASIASAPGRVGSKSLFRLYVVNENSLAALKSIAPHYMLDTKGRRTALIEPNLWSFARSSDKTGWHFIETSFPNLEQGYGPEARIYSIRARDETAYFYDTTWKIYWAQPKLGSTDSIPVAILVLPEGDVPMSRPIDPTSPKSVRDFEKSRRAVVELYKNLLYVPLKERGTPIVADDLAVQTLQETRRRWRTVLDKMRHFVDVLTDLLYVVASTTSGDRKAILGPKLDFNKAASHVFQILIKLNRYESMFIVTMSYLSLLADEDMFLASSGSRADLLHGYEDDHDNYGDNGFARARSMSRTGGLSNTGLSHLHSRRVSWRQVKKSQQDLMDTLRATKRQAESLRAIIDHQNSMKESRLANRHAAIANRHAAEASRQADEAAKQTASMRRMTILTFVFLPTTFVAAMFGLNVKEFGQGDTSIWMFFAVGVPFAGSVLAIWAWLEYWRQSTSSDGEGGELGKGMKEREEEMEAAMMARELEGKGEEEEGEEDELADGDFGSRVWEGGERIV